MHRESLYRLNSSLEHDKTRDYEDLLAFHYFFLKSLDQKENLMHLCLSNIKHFLSEILKRCKNFVKSKT